MAFKTFNQLLTSTICAAMIFASCAKEELTTVPTQGELSYDVNYSTEIKEMMGLSGKFLPRKVEGVYSKDGIKLSASGGLGMFRTDIVGTTTDSYLAININGDKMLVPFCDFFGIDDYNKANNDVLITNKDETEKICGFDSKCMIATAPSPKGDVHMKIYYVPVDGIEQSIANIPIKKIPGLITAIDMGTGSSNITFILSNIRSLENVLPSEFDRPNGYRLATRSDVDSIIAANIEL